MGQTIFVRYFTRETRAFWTRRPKVTISPVYKPMRAPAPTMLLTKETRDRARNGSFSRRSLPTGMPVNRNPSVLRLYPIRRSGQ